MSKVKSVLVDDMEHCYVCGRPGACIHHCVAGVGRRKVSDKYGLVIPLCHEHHEHVHTHRDSYLAFAQMAQMYYEQNIGDRDDWISNFGKSWL